MEKKEKIVLGITGLSHLLVHSQMLVLPNIFLVLQSQFSLGYDTLGLLATASAFMFGLGAIPAGYFERRIGGRTLLLTYQIGSSFSIVILLLASSLKSITIGLMLLGLFSSIYHPAGLTILSRRISQLSRGMAIHGIFGSVGLAAGPLLASLFTEMFSWKFAYGSLLIAHGILALMTLLLIEKRKPTVQEEDTIRGPEKSSIKALSVYYGIAILLGFAYTGFTTFIPTHFAVETRNLFPNVSDILRGGLFTTLVLVAGIIGQLIGGWAGDKYNRVTLIFWIVLVNIPLFALLGFSTGWVLICVGILVGIAHFSTQPVGNSLIATLTSSQSRGLGYGISFFFSFGVGSLAAMVSGWVGENYSLSAVFPLLAVLLIPGLWLAFRFRKFDSTNT